LPGLAPWAKNTSHGIPFARFRHPFSTAFGSRTAPAVDMQP
jgi:hypothetical protein